MSSSAVTAELILSLVVPGDSPLPVVAGIRYDASDPYAVEVTFRTGEKGEDGVRWVFARQLLTDGVTAMTGEGDVRVWPTMSDEGALITIEMSSPHGQAVFETPMLELVEFLARTYNEVPTGSESDHIDVDAALAFLLDES